MSRTTSNEGTVVVPFSVSTPEGLCGFSSHDPEDLQLAHETASNLYDESGSGGGARMDESEIQRFLGDQSRIMGFLQKVAGAAKLLDGLSEEVEPDEDRKRLLVSPCCPGCNDDCIGQNGRQLDENAYRFTDLLFQTLHEVNISLSILGYFVSRQDSELLLDCIFSATEHDLFPRPESDDGTMGVFFFVLSGLVYLFPHLTKAFPVARRQATSLHSMIVCRRPTAAFSGAEIDIRLAQAFGMVMAEQIPPLFDQVDEIAGDLQLANVFIGREILGFLSIVPTLYYMGTVKHIMKEVTVRDLLVQSLLHFLRIILSFCGRRENVDDLAVGRHPELKIAAAALKSLLVMRGDGEDPNDRQDCWRINLLENHLSRFALAAVLELLGWWVCREPSILDARYGYFGRNRTVQNIMASMSDKISRIQHESEDLAFIGPTMNDLLDGNKPAVPPGDKSLFHGPLMDANKRCGLPSCRSTRGQGGGDLLRCTGGCRGLEQYCCKEHQVKDWGRHKAFCKGNR